jgi:hypothetical protein
MKLSLGVQSILLFVLSLIFLVLLTLFESSLAGMSLTGEKIISALLLVLPGVVGVVLGVLSLLRRESRYWVAVVGVILNLVFGLFQTAVLLFAG